MLLGMLPQCSLQPASASADEVISEAECRFHPANRAPQGFQFVSECQGSAGYTPLLRGETQDMVVGGRSRQLSATSAALLQPLLWDISSESLTAVWRCKFNFTSHCSWLYKKLLAAALCNSLSGISARHCGTRTEVTLLSQSGDSATQQELRMSVSARKILPGLEAVRAQRTATKVTHFLPAS